MGNRNWIAPLLIVTLPIGAHAFTDLTFDGAPLTGSLVSGETEWIPQRDPRSDVRFLRESPTPRQ